MRVLVLGGDGFCGWPTALHLSARGHDVTIADSLVRRDIDRELGVESLTPIRSLRERCETWTEITGRYIRHVELDVATDADRLLDVIHGWQPGAIIHFAEQRAAPYSMKSPAHKRYTVTNNLSATNSLLAAIAEAGTDPHVIHLGTMGVYGYGGGVRLPEGYQPVTLHGPDGEAVHDEILYPPKPGSIYHVTKAQDQLLFDFYARNDRLRITDLHQGIVWGTQTDQTARDERLVNRFDYDGDFGTVLNRFLVQAAAGHPLTVHGTGEQTRAFIHIQDTVRCIELAIANPPSAGQRPRILNQMTETHRLIDLACKVSALTGAPIAHVDNPRNEAPANDLSATNAGLRDLGLDPTTLDDGLLDEAHAVAARYAHRCDLAKIPCTSRWSA